MSEEYSHIIHKQILNIRTDSPSSLPDIRSDFYNGYKKILSDQLDELYPKFFKTDQYVTIDHLEIAIDTLSIDHWEKELPNKLTETLYQALHDLSNASSESAGTSPIETKSAHFELLKMYLQTGMLPPWVQKTPDWKTVKQLIIDTETERIKDFILKNLSTSGFQQLIKRILSVFSDEELLKILEPGIESSAGSLIRLLVNQIKSQYQTATSNREIVWSATFQALDTGNDISSVELLEAYIINAASVNPVQNPSDLLTQFEDGFKSSGLAFLEALFSSASYQALHQRIANNQTTSDHKSEDKTNDEDQSVNLNGSPTFNTKSADNSTSGKEDNATNQEVFGADESMPANHEQHDEKEKNMESVAQKHKNRVLVGNAGLILLWPFLEAYFEAAGLTSQDGFKNEPAAIKAVFHLHYLATGEERPAMNYDLILPRLLCGLDTEHELPLEFELSVSEKDFANGLVQALIDNWPAVKDTSIESVRETYFRRDGKLSAKNDGWLLEVKKEAWDILLDRLPWGIGIIHLPWMEEMIHVEWKYQT